jgi:hypothetical protein
VPLPLTVADTLTTEDPPLSTGPLTVDVPDGDERTNDKSATVDMTSMSGALFIIAKFDPSVTDALDRLEDERITEPLPVRLS